MRKMIRNWFFSAEAQKILDFLSVAEVKIEGWSETTPQDSAQKRESDRDRRESFAMRHDGSGICLECWPIRALAYPADYTYNRTRFTGFEGIIISGRLRKLKKRHDCWVEVEGRRRQTSALTSKIETWHRAGCP